jgi:hypothetical protein
VGHSFDVQLLHREPDEAQRGFVWTSGKSVEHGLELSPLGPIAHIKGDMQPEFDVRILRRHLHISEQKVDVALGSNFRDAVVHQELDSGWVGRGQKHGVEEGRRGITGDPQSSYPHEAEAEPLQVVCSSIVCCCIVLHDGDTKVEYSDQQDNQNR